MIAKHENNCSINLENKSLLLIISLLIIILTNSCEKEVSTSPEMTPVPVGYLYIDSNPHGAKIYENGRFTGKYTPDSLYWLEEKMYEFTLKQKLYRDTTFTVKIIKGEKKKLMIDYLDNPKMYGRINFISKPDSANIELDGKSLELKTPSVIGSIVPGKHKIVYDKKNCIPDSIEIIVKSNETTDAFLSLVDTTYWVQYSTVNSGILSNQLSSVAVDQDGLLWIGSYNGLSTFNGKEWKYYNTSNTPLSDDYVTLIKVDPENNKWVGTFNGLNKFNGVFWTAWSENPKEFPGIYIKDISFNKDGSIWAATLEGLVVNYGGNSWKLKYEQPTSGVLEDKRGHVWITIHTGGVGEYFSRTAGYPSSFWRFYYRFEEDHNNLYGCLAASENAVWFGHYQSPDYPYAVYGLSSISYGLKTRVNYPVFNGAEVNDIVIENNEKWICTNRGLYVFEHYPNYKRYTPNNSQLKDYNITGVALDGNGNVWVATSNAGLYRFKKPW